MEFEVECRGTAEVSSIVRIEATSMDEAEDIARSLDKDWEIITITNVEYCGAKAT